MKFGKRLCSMLFEIYPDAHTISFNDKKDRLYMSGDAFVLWGEELNSYQDVLKNPSGATFKFNKFACNPPDEGEPTEYTRDEIFVHGDEVEFKLRENKWVKGIFSHYENNVCIVKRPHQEYVFSFESCSYDLVRKPQSEEMVTVAVLGENLMGGFHKNKSNVHEIPKSKAEELGLI